MHCQIWQRLLCSLHDFKDVFAQLVLMPLETNQLYRALRGCKSRFGDMYPYKTCSFLAFRAATWACPKHSQ